MEYRGWEIEWKDGFEATHDGEIITGEILDDVIKQIDEKLDQ